MKRFESTFYGTKSTELFCQTWQTANPMGTVVITHGLAEHSECYHHFAQSLVKTKWNVVGWDLRGHGRSEGKRGYVEDFKDYVADFQTLTKFLFENEKIVDSGPLILFGHSMGGLIALCALIFHGNMGYRAVCLSAPLLGIEVDVPKIKEKMAQWAAQWLPQLTLHNEICYKDLTRDEEFLKTYENDPLRHDKISPNLFLGIIENMQIISQETDSIQIPVLMQLSGQDKIVSTRAAENFYEQLSTPQKTLHIYPDSYHEIYNDLDKDLAFHHLKEFLSAMV